MLTIATIQQAVANHYRLPLRIMREPSGATPPEHVRPRQVAMCLAMRLTDHSFGRVGHFFGGRDPTTVRHAMNATQLRSRTDQKLHNALRRITLELVRH